MKWQGEPQLPSIPLQQSHRSNFTNKNITPIAPRTRPWIGLNSIDVELPCVARSLVILPFSPHLFFAEEYWYAIALVAVVIDCGSCPNWLVVKCFLGRLDGVDAAAGRRTPNLRRLQWRGH